MKTAVPSQIELRVPRRPEFVRFARGAAKTLALHMDLTLADARDVELAVGEACTNALEHVAEPSCDEILVRFVIEEERFGVEVIDHGPGFDVSRLEQAQTEGECAGGLGLTVIRAVMDEVEIECDPETGTCVRMVKHRARLEG